MSDADVLAVVVAMRAVDGGHRRAAGRQTAGVSGKPWTKKSSAVALGEPSINADGYEPARDGLVALRVDGMTCQAGGRAVGRAQRRVELRVAVGKLARSEARAAHRLRPRALRLPSVRGGGRRGCRGGSEVRCALPRRSSSVR